MRCLSLAGCWHRMRILNACALCVAETFLPATNGVVNCVLHIARELAAGGHTPVVVAPAGDPEWLPVIGRNPVPVRSVPATRVPGYSFAAAVWTCSLIRLADVRRERQPRRFRGSEASDRCAGSMRWRIVGPAFQWRCTGW